MPISKAIVLLINYYPKNSQILTCEDIKKYAKLSCHIKWQRCSEVSGSSRNLYNFRPMVSLKPPKNMFIPFITENRPILQLRLGYVLNEYRYKVGLQESLKCRCGEIETVEHYICDCELYEM